MGNVIDLTGKKFGRLTVLGLNTTMKAKHDTLWQCRCDCGVELIVRGSNLRRYHTKSCGCLRAEKSGAWLRGYMAERRRFRGQQKGSHP